jgi:hypothetical protein
MQHALDMYVTNEVNKAKIILALKRPNNMTNRNKNNVKKGKNAYRRNTLNKIIKAVLLYSILLRIDMPSYRKGLANSINSFNTFFPSNNKVHGNNNGVKNLSVNKVERIKSDIMNYIRSKVESGKFVEISQRQLHDEIYNEIHPRGRIIPHSMSQDSASLAHAVMGAIYRSLLSDFDFHRLISRINKFTRKIQIDYFTILISKSKQNSNFALNSVIDDLQTPTHYMEKEVRDFANIVRINNEFRQKVTYM